ncbi:TRAP transporter small permease [Hwanghaeella sp.]|uniref:TRAP transporter small permease n=1 Tax=Hwanghaeella sp. TaxID=2605943 RepID=UPI003CCC0012
MSGPIQFLYTLLRRFLETVTIALIVTLACVVIVAVVARYVFNSSFIWYDEVASILLAWITFYGAAYAAMQRRHLGFEGLVLACPPKLRAVLFILAEIIVYAVFIILAHAGWVILKIMGNETLVSLRWVPLWFTQSVVPVGAGLFILAQILSTPQTITRLRAGRSVEDEEIAEEIAKAEASSAHSRVEKH